MPPSGFLSSPLRSSKFLRASRRLPASIRYLSTAVPVDLEFERFVPPDGNTQEEPLVILHGFFGSKRNWHSLSKAFMKDLNRPVYALDLRNSGSSPHAEPMTYESMSADVLHFCQKHSLRDVSLMGHSMGGKVAMSLALNPQLPSGILSKLISVDIAPSTGDISSEFRGYLEAMRRIETSGLQKRQEAQVLLEEYEKDASVRAFLLTNLNTVRPDEPLKFKVPLAILERAIPDIGAFPYKPEEQIWDGPALLIKGEKSKYVNRRNIPITKKFFPNMRLEALDTGHWVHAEKPNDFKKIVTSFISA